MYSVQFSSSVHRRALSTMCDDGIGDYIRKRFWGVGGEAGQEGIGIAGGSNVVGTLQYIFIKKPDVASLLPNRYSIPYIHTFIHTVQICMYGCCIEGGEGRGMSVIRDKYAEPSCRLMLHLVQ